ncbi:MAG: hypothetical protein AAF298_10205 [Cyanobacteria bacterium P01_A01_bin.40]
MGWINYNLDYEAQKLVLAAKKRDAKSLNQAFKMRETVAYGLERFWGEHLRLQDKEEAKSQYWKETWKTLVAAMAVAGVKIPKDPVSKNNVESVEGMAEQLWGLELNTQRVALSVLTQLCDSLVWWTQRYK